MTTRPEYTPEQVEAARDYLDERQEMYQRQAVNQVINGNTADAAKWEEEATSIRTILSALARITAELTTCRETLRLKPSELLPAGVTRLTWQVRDAEAFANRWMTAALYATPVEDGEPALAFDSTNPEAFAESRRHAYDTRITALRSRLESAERDTARLDWLDGHAGLAAGDLTPETLCRDAAFGWLKVPRFGDPRRALRDAIDAASAHSPTPTQGGTNG